jgi:adenosine deaminase
MKNNDIKNIADLKNRFNYKDFSHFLENWVWINQFLKEYEDFTFISKEIANHLKSQNIKYAELFYTPGRHVEKNLKPQKVTEAIIAGFEYYEKEIDIKLICDLSRDSGPDAGIYNKSLVHSLSRLGTDS